MRPHRCAYELATGVPLREGEVLRHVCNMPTWVHPEPGAQIKLKFHAKEVQLVLSGEGKVGYLLNGKPMAIDVSGVPNACTLTMADQASDEPLNSACLRASEPFPARSDNRNC